MILNIDKFIKNNWGLFIYGPPSQGKTEVQSCVVNELCIDKDYKGIMVNVKRLMGDLKDAVGKGTLNKILDTIKKNEIIALNDITGGKRPQDEFSPFERGIIYELVDAVYEKEKTLIITGKYNYDWVEDKLGTDVKDRIIQMCGIEPILMKGHNFREEHGKKRDAEVKKMIQKIS
ncbi:IstB-like ATP binding protein [Orenia metallireducens]|uniref:IstB-like ATP binding protein n=2 Tax=Orenia metallireducens TaxID=1413210 RepID=A0A285G852_9FIRM|nr:IstB-like ATP binding protein [Orenia metallireducens]